MTTAAASAAIEAATSLLFLIFEPGDRIGRISPDRRFTFDATCAMLSGS